MRNIYTKQAIIKPEQLEAVDQVICFLFNNHDVWQRLTAVEQKAADTLDKLVQEQW